MNTTTSNNAEIIAFINASGGIGKSSLCFHIAWCLATERNKTVLMVDLDGQRANLTFFAGIEKDDNLPTMYDVLADGKNIMETVLMVEDLLHIIPATVDVAGLDVHNSSPDAMKTAIRVLVPYYDYIFIDVSPTPNQSHALALAAADSVIIPMLPDITSLEANMGIIESIMLARQHLNPALRVLGIVLNRYTLRHRLSKQVEATSNQIADAMNTRVFGSKIRSVFPLSENVGQHMGITAYAPKSDAAKDYRNLCDEIESEVMKHGLWEEEMGKQVLFDPSSYNLPQTFVVPTPPPESPAVPPAAEPNPALVIPAPVHQPDPEISATADVTENIASEISTQESDLSMSGTDMAADNEAPFSNAVPDTRKSVKTGRRSKETAPNKKKERKTVPLNRPTTTIYFNNPDTQQRAWVYAKLIAKDSISNSIVTAFEDVLNYSYQCDNPACNGMFVSSSKDGEALQPQNCPFCGSQKLRHRKTPSM